MIGMRGKIGVWVMAGAMIFTQTSSAMTIQEVIDALGDVAALEQICPMIAPVQDHSVITSFFDENGLKWELFDYSGPYHADIDVAKLRATNRRMAYSVKKNCEDGVALYGPAGSIHPGFITGNSEDWGNLKDISINAFIDTIGDIGAVMTICPAFIWTKDSDAAANRFRESSGLTKTNDVIDRQIFKAVESLDGEGNRAFEKRKMMSASENCDDGWRLYGPDGTKIPGLFTVRKSSN